MGRDNMTSLVSVFPHRIPFPSVTVQCKYTNTNTCALLVVHIQIKESTNATKITKEIQKIPYPASQCDSAIHRSPLVSPNLAQINFGPWELHSVIFPDPPLRLLIPLTANLITDGQEIQKSS